MTWGLWEFEGGQNGYESIIDEKLDIHCDFTNVYNVC